MWVLTETRLKCIKIFLFWYFNTDEIRRSYLIIFSIINVILELYSLEYFYKVPWIPFTANLFLFFYCWKFREADCIYLNPLTPKITDFLTHFRPLLTKWKREYIMTKPCIHNVFGSPLSIYEVKITLSCTGKPIWRILF